ncbi:MAG: ATP-binding protein [Bacillota bacterium]|nr:ATP-binding protein [Bacillota bacterium]
MRHCQSEAEINEALRPALQDVLNAFPAGIMVVNRSGKIVGFNRFLEEATGLSQQEVVGRSLQDLFQKKEFPREHPLLLTLTAGREFDRLVPENILPFTCPFPAYASTHALVGGDGDRIGALAVLWDARHQQELEQAVVRAERLAIMGQLAAVAVHEIRNSLTAVGGFLQLLKHELEGTPRVEYADIMLEALARANSIIGDFLRLAKPGLPQRKPCDLRDLMESVIKLLENERARRGIAVKAAYAPDLPMISLDEEQFKQVLLNIFNNALDVMPDGGEIALAVECDREANVIQISVRDTGPGIPEAVQAQVFEPFFTTKETGTGLGLYISRAIVQNHGGEIKIENNPDQGCRVIILLPQG